MNLFNLFKKGPRIDTLAPLRVDFHSHLLPGIDDGAQTVEDSVTLIRRLHALGFDHIWTTPHVMADLYPNTPEIIREKLAIVRQAVSEAGIDVHIDAAAEYLLDEAFGQKLERDEVLTLPGKRVLVEMSFVSPPPQLDRYLFQLQTKGYRIILAHPERYLFFRRDWSEYGRLHARGIEFQVNFLSLTGHYGSSVFENAQKLLAAGLVDYIATDMHHEEHADKITDMLSDGKSSRLLAKHLAAFKNSTLI